MKLIDCSTPKFPNTFTMVDDEDFEYLSQWKWSPINGSKNTIYLMRKSEKGGQKKTIMLHRLINKTPDNLVTDHIDRNGLNNQKSNLRSCSHSQNQINRPKNFTKPTSLFKGVSKRKSGVFRAQIEKNGERVYLGNYPNEMGAAIAYNLAASRFFGEFALLNKINGFD